MATTTPASSQPNFNTIPGVELAGTVGQTDLHPMLTRRGLATSELWFHVAAIALSALFASGAIPTSGPWATIALIAAAELSAFGYQVSRNMAKGGLAKVVAALSQTTMLVLLLVTSSSGLTACAPGSTVRKDTAIGVTVAASCTFADVDANDLHDAGVFVDRQVAAWIAGVKPGDLDAAKAAILADLAPLKGKLWPCLFAGAIAAVTAPSSAPGTTSQALTATAPSSASTVRDAFQVVARQLGWPQLSTPGGAV